MCAFKKEIGFLAGTIILSLAFSAGPALAADADAPAAATVVIAWGGWLAANAGTIADAALLLILWVARGLPAEWQARLRTARAEQLLDYAVRYGINAVAGASADKVLSVHVAGPVTASALTYALNQGSARLIRWMGGPTAIAEMIWARLDVSAEAGRPDLERIAGSIRQ